MTELRCWMVMAGGSGGLDGLQVLGAEGEERRQDKSTAIRRVHVVVVVQEYSGLGEGVCGRSFRLPSDYNDPSASRPIRTPCR